MATFSVTSNANWQDSAFSTRAGNDTYNINGAVLTINTDTRYCTNASSTTGNLGPVTISSTLGGSLVIDGTEVRLIAYTSGSGNVPAIGTTITNSSGGITGYLLGVWSALNVAPTSVGASMPSSGYIKVKDCSGSFTSGVLSGIGATSSGADVPGWIEVVGVDGQTLTAPRLGSVSITGAWFEAGTTNGSANQQIQMPASLTNTYYSGVWIETSVGSNSFEFYPNVGTATTVIATDSVRGKVVWISSQGLLTIAKTSFGGYTPTSGLKIRAPNILLITCTSGTPTANSYNATVTSRFKFDTSTGGPVYIDKAMSTWYGIFNSPYSLSLSNSGFLDGFFVATVASPINFDNIGIGIGTNINTTGNNQINTLFSGGAITNSVFSRYKIQIGASVLQSTSNFDLTYTNCKFLGLVDRTTSGTQAQGFLQTSGKNMVFTNCTMIGGSMAFTSVADVTMTDVSYCDLITGNTTSSNGMSSIAVNRCSNFTIDGMDFGGQTNAHPYDGMVAARDTDRLTIRNIGSTSSSLDLGSANACSVVYGGGVYTQAGNTNMRLQHIYVTNPRNGTLATFLSGDSGISVENCWTDASDTISINSQSVVYKGLFAGGVIPTSFTAVYGTHFFDTFVSTTAGYIGLFMNEPTASTASYISQGFSSGSGFTATGSLVLATSSDYVTWTWPHYILGYTGFAATAPSVTGTNATSNQWYEYQINKNDGNGFNGSFKNFYYQRTGGSTTSGSPTISMTSTTGVAIGDRVYGTNITAGTYVVSVDNGTQCTLSANATGSGSGLTFVMSALNGETGVSASLGFKLMIRVTCTTSNTSNTITGCSCTGNTDASSQTTQYPLDTVTISITVLDGLGSGVSGARVAIYKTSDNSELLNALTDVSGVATGSVTFATNIPIYIRVRKSSTGSTRYINNDSVGVVTSSGFSSVVTLISDTVASP